MYVKDAGGGGGSSSSRKSYSSYKNTSSNTEENSGPSAAELFAAAKRKVYREIKEYTKEAREYVKKINTTLENVSNIIQDALTGGTAQVIKNNISNAIKKQLMSVINWQIYMIKRIKKKKNMVEFQIHIFHPWKKRKPI